MAGTADEAELHASDGIKGCEHLLMAFGVNDYVSKQWHARSIKRVSSKASIQNFNGDVLHARTVFGQALMNCWVVVSAHKNNSDATCFCGNNGGIVSDSGGKTHSIKKLSCSNEVSHCHNDMVNTTRNSVKFCALCVASQFDGC
jgi:hypothetical protein